VKREEKEEGGEFECQGYGKKVEKRYKPGFVLEKSIKAAKKDA